MHCAREVKALLCPLNKVPQTQGREQRVYYIGSYYAPPPHVLYMHRLVRKQLIERQNLAGDNVEEAYPKA